MVVAVGDSAVIRSAQEELLRGVRGMLGRTLRVEERLPNENAIVLATLADLAKAAPALALTANLQPDGYWIATRRAGTLRHLVVTAANERGVLYGTFALLRSIGLHKPITIGNREFDAVTVADA